MQVEIKNRWTSAVIFTAEVECEADAGDGLKLGLAIMAALKSGANMRGADLSGAYLSRANLSDADLSDADLSAADLSDADLRGADLRGADLSGAYLRGANLRAANLSAANLSAASLSAANLSDANLRDANLSDADLSGADLRDANLSRADLSDLSDVPRIPGIHNAVYAAASAPGALDMGSWHTCETTHCRAGWVVTLAGEAGAALEERVSTPTAAALIYIASDPTLERIPDFYASNEDALADMRRLAEAEVAERICR